MDGSAAEQPLLRFGWFCLDFFLIVLISLGLCVLVYRLAPSEASVMNLSKTCCYYSLGKACTVLFREAVLGNGPCACIGEHKQRSVIKYQIWLDSRVVFPRIYP